MKRLLALPGLVLVACLAAGCSQKEPARTAIDAAESALAAVSEPAQKYVPKQYAAAKAELDAARRDFRDEQYVRAIDGVKDIPARARALAAAAATAREELARQLAADWERLQRELPGKLAGIDGRLGELARARRLPAGLDDAALARLGASAGVARKAWDEGSAAYQAGNLEGAVARGLESDTLAGELMVELGMTPAPAVN